MRISGFETRQYKNKSVYYFRYTAPNGQQRRRKIASVGEITQIQAIRIAQTWRSQLILGIDPHPDPASQRASQSLTEGFLYASNRHWAKPQYTRSGWSAEVSRIYSSLLEPVFGDRPMQSVGFDDVESWLSDFSDRPVQGNRALAVLSKIFQLNRVHPNPCTGVERFKERSRNRFATMEEIRKIIEVIHRLKEQGGVCLECNFLLLLLFTGARPKFLTDAKAEDVIANKITRDGKSGIETVVIPHLAMKYISGLGVKAPRKLWEQIRTEAGCPDLWMRDLRRTFASIGLSNGKSLSLVGELLNHKSAQTTKIYAKLMDDERMEAAIDIAERIAG